MDKFYSSSFRPRRWRWNEEKKFPPCPLFTATSLQPWALQTEPCGRYWNTSWGPSSVCQNVTLHFARLPARCWLISASKASRQESQNAGNRCRPNVWKKKTNKQQIEIIFHSKRRNIRGSRSRRHGKNVVKVLSPPVLLILAAAQVLSGAWSFYGWLTDWIRFWHKTSSHVFYFWQLWKKILSKWLECRWNPSPAVSALPFILWPCQATGPPHNRGRQQPDEWALEQNTVFTSSPLC